MDMSTSKIHIYPGKIMKITLREDDSMFVHYGEATELDPCVECGSTKARVAVGMWLPDGTRFIDRFCRPCKKETTFVETDESKIWN
jgi:hypothetical protein